MWSSESENHTIAWYFDIILFFIFFIILLSKWSSLYWINIESSSQFYYIKQEKRLI